MLRKLEIFVVPPVCLRYSVDGREPYAGLAFDASGDLFGATALGGDLTCIDTSAIYDVWGCGTTYELTKSGGSWNETVLQRFDDGTDGSFPFGSLVFDASVGAFHGATANAYPSSGDYGGTIFQQTSGGLTTTYSLAGAVEQVSGPHSGMVMDAAGNLYGTTATGGAHGYGSVFELSTSGMFTTLYSFQSGDDGAYPVGGLAIDSDGNLYGTTYAGVTDGTGCSTAAYPLGCGEVFELVP